MNETQRLQAIRNEFRKSIKNLEQLDEKLKNEIEDAKQRERNIELTRSDAEKVMGYQSGYLNQIDVDEPVPFEDGLVLFEDLYAWAKRNRKNRLKDMRKNIDDLI